MQTRTGVSCSAGGGDSFGSGVELTVGLAAVPSVSDQMLVLVPWIVEQ